MDDRIESALTTGATLGDIDALILKHGVMNQWPTQAACHAFAADLLASQVAQQATATNEKIDTLAQEYACAGLLRAAPARPLAAPQASKAAGPYLKAFADAQMRGMGMVKASSEGVEHIQFDEFMLPTPASKADTGEVPFAVLDALVEGCAQAIARPDSSGCEDAKACSHALGLYRDWKSATPSTIKAEPAGEQQ